MFFAGKSSNNCSTTCWVYSWFKRGRRTYPEFSTTRQYNRRHSCGFIGGFHYRNHSRQVMYSILNMTHTHTYIHTYRYYDQPEFQPKLQDICLYYFRIKGNVNQRLVLSCIVHQNIIVAIWLIIGCEKTIPPPNKKRKRKRKKRKTKQDKKNNNKALNNYCFNAIPS